MNNNVGAPDTAAPPPPLPLATPFAGGGDPTLANTPSPQVSPQMLQQQREEAARAINDMLTSQWHNIQYAQTPWGAIEDFADIMGSPQRAVGRIIQGIEAHRNPLGITSDVIGGVFHPGDTDASGRDVTAQETEAIRALYHAPTHDAIDAWTNKYVPPEFQGTVAGILKFGEDFGLQTSTDPLTAAWGVGRLSALRYVKPLLQGLQTTRAMQWYARSAGALKALPWLSHLQDAYGNALHGLGSLFESEPELDKILTPEGRKIKFQIDNAAEQKGARIAAQDKELLATGTPQDVQNRYILYQSGLQKTPATAAQVANWRRTFGAMSPDEQRAAIDAARGQTVAAHRARMLETQLNAAGAYKQGTQPRSAQQWTTWVQQHPPFAQWLSSHAVGRALQATFAPFKDLMTASLFLNFLPHGGRNVGELVGLGANQSAKTVAGAIGHLTQDVFNGAWGKAMKAARSGNVQGTLKALEQIGTLPVNQAKRLEAAGARATYTHDLEKMLLARLPVVGKGWQAVVQPLQHFLTSVEDHWRFSLMEDADRKFGQSRSVADELRKGAYVNDIAGDYNHAGKLADIFSMFGGAWTAFRLGIVPRAVLRALSTTGGRAKLAGYLRGQYDLQHSRSPESQMNNALIIGGPPQDFAELGGAVAAMTEGNFEPIFRYGTAGAGIGEAGRTGDEFYRGPAQVQVAKQLAQQVNPLRSAGDLTQAAQGKSRPMRSYADNPQYMPTNLTERLLDSVLSTFGAYYAKKAMPTSRTAARSQARQEQTNLQMIRHMLGLPDI